MTRRADPANTHRVRVRRGSDFRRESQLACDCGGYVAGLGELPSVVTWADVVLAMPWDGDTRGHAVRVQSRLVVTEPWN